MHTVTSRSRSRRPARLPSRVTSCVKPLVTAAAALACQGSLAQASARPADAWSFGAVLDVTHTSRALALGGRDHGLQLGHSDFSAGGPIGPWLRGQLTAVLATHEGKLEKGIEEAWVETTSLPAGLQWRGGRFASQIGYLNAQHPHADDFVERPLLYRAFFGGHWFDDGMRINWTAPTPFFLQLGAELFRGRKLVPEVANTPRSPGLGTVTARIGADLDKSNSWQLGLSHVRSRREAAVEEGHEGEDTTDGAAHAHEHEHEHGAAFSGRKTWLLDATWKWAPDGNNRERQLRVNLELARITGLNRFATGADRHESQSLSVVWRFHPSWEAGIRADRLRVRMPHDDHFDDGKLHEHALMVAWKPTHLQTLRLQLTQQRNAVGIEDAARRSVQLQYVVGFGAHGAHAY